MGKSGRQRRVKDLTGQRFGSLEVKGPSKNTVCGGEMYWHCLCDCGEEREVKNSSLVSGMTKSCGCRTYKKKNLEGERFGKLVVMQQAYTKQGKHGRITYWKCRCDCGNEKLVSRGNLVQGNVKSCGCIVGKYHKNIVEDTNISIISSSKVSKNNTSGHVGVSWQKSAQKWVARIAFKKQNYFLGCFDKYEDAVVAREIAEKQLHGQFLEWYARAYPERCKE